MELQDCMQRGESWLCLSLSQPVLHEYVKDNVEKEMFSLSNNGKDKIISAVLFLSTIINKRDGLLGGYSGGLHTSAHHEKFELCVSGKGGGYSWLVKSKVSKSSILYVIELYMLK